MKISIIGSRGIPANYGGFETFAEKISECFIADGHNVLVVGDSKNQKSKSNDDRLTLINSSYAKQSNPILFWHNSFKIAVNWKADIIICCGIAGVFSIPFFYNFKGKIYVNPDGLGFKRTKYSIAKKIFLFSQFIFCSLFVKNIICDSKAIANFFKDKLFRSRGVFTAEYGASLENTKYLNPSFFEKIILKYNIKIKKNKYFLVVARLEPENNILTIIKAHILSKNDFPLVIVGAKNTKFYYKKLLKYDNLPKIHFIGGVYNSKDLTCFRKFSFSYLHGHSVGGTNPSLLESMAIGNFVIAHDNKFNRETLSEFGVFFNSVDDLKQIFCSDILRNSNQILNYKRLVVERINNYYSWNLIYKKYLNAISK
tara:strand:+ start:2846 stop:3952 length:1107 start_codon:yes stop_codon:yes gene_type:complete